MQSVRYEISRDLGLNPSQALPDRPVLVDRPGIDSDFMDNPPNQSYLLKYDTVAMAFMKLSVAMDDPPDFLPLDIYDPTKP